MIEWTLPWPPKTTNALYRNIPGRGRAMVPEARAWKDGAMLLVKVSGQGLPSGRLALTLYLYPPKGFRGDASNCIKLAEDAIFGAFGETDHRVAEIRVYRGYPGADPHIVAVIEPAWWRTIDEVRAS